MTKSRKNRNRKEEQAVKATHCPNCNAAPGEPCTSPTDNGRTPVTYVHFAREEAAR